jgi:hypothetical protein
MLNFSVAVIDWYLDFQYAPRRRGLFLKARGVSMFQKVVSAIQKVFAQEEGTIAGVDLGTGSLKTSPDTTLSFIPVLGGTSSPLFGASFGAPLVGYKVSGTIGGVPVSDYIDPDLYNEVAREMRAQVAQSGKVTEIPVALRSRMTSMPDLSSFES